MIKKLYQIFIRILVVFVAILFISTVWIGVFEKSSDKETSETDKKSAEASQQENKYDYLKLNEVDPEEVKKQPSIEEKVKQQNTEQEEDLSKAFDIKADNFDKEMQRVAEKLTLEDFSIKLKECGSQEMISCEYNISGEIVLVTTGDKKSYLTSNVILFFGKDGDVFSFMSTVGLLIATIDPSLTKNERGKIFNNTVSKISPEKGEDNDYDFIYNGFKYNVSTDEILGISFYVEKE